MLYEFVAALCSGIFAGAAVYINLVEHPARLECGLATAVAEFRPSYRRATVMQASLAAVGSLAALIGWWAGDSTSLLIAGLLFGSVIPFTLIVILPTNKRLLDTALDVSSPEAAALLRRWAQLHLVRSVASGIAFIMILVDIVRRS